MSHSSAGRGALVGLRNVANNQAVRKALLTIVPVVIEKGRSGIPSLYKRRFPQVAVTGMAGVGKTVLVDHLRGTKKPYTAPDRSLREERIRQGVLKGIRYRVVPGHTSGERIASLERLFHQERVDGVMHIIANGFATLRADQYERSTCAQSLEALREEQRENERKELAEVIAHLNASVLTTRSPTWLLLSVNKIDLYPEELDSVLQYYSPGGSSEMSRQLRELVGFVGAGNFAWEALPICTYLGDYEWRGERVPSRLSDEQRNERLEEFKDRLMHLAGHL